MKTMKRHTAWWKGLCLCALLCTLGLPQAKAQQIAVKTNALMWMATMPNVGCEFVVGERSTVDVTLATSTSIIGKKARTLVCQPEYRYWFNGRPMTREYVGLGIIGTSYDITWGEKIFEGDAGGLGLTFGYVLNFANINKEGKFKKLYELSKRLNVEFTGGCGWVFFQQRQYYVNDSFDDYTGTGTVQANAKGYKILPLKLGVSVTWILK